VFPSFWFPPHPANTDTVIVAANMNPNAFFFIKNTSLQKLLFFYFIKYDGMIPLINYQ